LTIETVFAEIVQQVVSKAGSDLYFLPDTQGYRVLFLAGGRRYELRQLSEVMGMRMVRFIKFQSGMDISETRRPQLGRLFYQMADHDYNCRISSVGDFLNRESIVIRFLYQLQDVGMRWVDPSQIKKLQELVKSKSGLILLSGRMGSGKTSTLYQAIQTEKKERLILSIEDPVEIEEPNILQLQVNELAMMTHQSLLKLALRHHPEIMIIGEIRDADTAKIVVEAALSGHLILSTVHATSHVGVWLRMLELGVDESSLAHVLIGIGYQQMVQHQCENAVDLEFLQGPEVIETIQRAQNE